MADNFSQQDSPYPIDSPNVRDITSGDNASTSRPPVALSFEDLEYDDVTPAEKYPPTDTTYEQRRHRHVNPNQNTALYVAGVSYNVAEDAGRAVGGLLGKAFRGARKMVGGSEQIREADVEGPKLSHKEYKTVQGKWNKSAAQKRVPLSCSNGLIEVSEDEEDEADYLEAMNKDYLDLDTKTQPGNIRMREAPVPNTAPSAPKDPTRNEQADRYSMSEGSDSSFETAEGGVDWPLDNDKKARHMAKVAERRVEEIQARREVQIDDLENEKTLARRMREDERERKAKELIKRIRAKEARDMEKVKELLEQHHDPTEQMRPRPQNGVPTHQPESSLPHRQTEQPPLPSSTTQKVRRETSCGPRKHKRYRPSSTQQSSHNIEAAYAPMRIRAAVREENMRREQLENEDRARREQEKEAHRRRLAHDAIASRNVDDALAAGLPVGCAETVSVPSSTSRVREGGAFPAGPRPSYARRVPLAGLERERKREEEAESSIGEVARFRFRERERVMVRERQREVVRDRSGGEMERLTQDVRALSIGSGCKKGENEKMPGEWHDTS